MIRSIFSHFANLVCVKEEGNFSFVFYFFKYSNGVKSQGLTPGQTFINLLIICNPAEILFPCVPEYFFHRFILLIV